MQTVSRRKLLIGATAGAAAIGALAVPVVRAVEAPKATAPVPAGTGPVMVYVTDPASGMVAVLSGNKEVTFKDPALVVRLLNATR